MNLPQPGTPEFEKLILGMPKPEYTKLPAQFEIGNVHIPGGWGGVYGLSPIAAAAKQLAAAEETAMFGGSSPTLFGFPVCTNLPSNWASSSDINIVADVLKIKAELDKAYSGKPSKPLTFYNGSGAGWIHNLKVHSPFGPHFHQHSFVDDLIARAFHGRLDCSDDEADAVARAFDWDRRDVDLDFMTLAIVRPNPLELPPDA